jgi:hypothetical protein
MKCGVGRGSRPWEGLAVQNVGPDRLVSGRVDLRKVEGSVLEQSRRRSGIESSYTRLSWDVGGMNFNKEPHQYPSPSIMQLEAETLPRVASMVLPLLQESAGMDPLLGVIL